jgi:hypothetical protein
MSRISLQVDLYMIRKNQDFYYQCGGYRFDVKDDGFECHQLTNMCNYEI